MLIDCGQAYTITVPAMTIPTTAAAGSTIDIFNIATSSTVPILVTRVVATAAQTAAAIGQVQLMRRSGAGSGGTGVSALPTNGGSSASSVTATYLVVTTIGGAGNVMDSQQWNEFAPYEFNQKPSGVLVPSSGFLSLALVGLPAGTYTAAFTVELVELK